MSRSYSDEWPRDARRAFSLVELVLVVAIIGIISAIAAPRIGHASRASSANALLATMSNVRLAIDCYYGEHGRYPGYDPDSGTPNGSDFVLQLTQFSALTGHTSSKSTGAYVLGPYLRGPFPKNPSNDLDTVYVKATLEDAGPPDGSVGWVAVLSHGEFSISATTEGLDQIGLDTSELKQIALGGKDQGGDQNGDDDNQQ